MEALFVNTGFLVIAGALISVPIIIHLINRMRFKRIRWAAMEFLLKAQKRTRRRLIIEQLLLLALRCFLIALVGLLVSRFIGCGDSNFGGKPSLHIVLLDDTPSMQDKWKQEGADKDAFEVAKSDILLRKIGKALSASKSNDRLIVLPMSKLTEDFDAKEFTYDRLNDPEKMKKLTQDINELQPSMVHASPMECIKVVRKLMGSDDNAQSIVTVHLVGDFRNKDWSPSAAEGLNKELLDMVKNKKGEVKLRFIDTVHPPRAANQGGYPPSRDNVGIVDVRPSTRIVGKNMPVQFTVTIRNFSGKYVEASLVARNEATAKDMEEINFNPQNPLKLSPGADTVVTFEQRFNPDVKAGESYFAHLSVRLENAQRGKLDNDALAVDNLRYVSVEVRDKVPVLIIDGERAKGREESKDSFFIGRSLISVPGASYQIDYDDELAPGQLRAGKSLERTDLQKYPTIFLLNVPDLTPKQLANLENYVKEGGGVAFYMGPLVNSAYYNKSLYKEGKGIFPAPIKENFFPPSSEKELEPKDSDTFQLLVRDDKFGGENEFQRRLTPIFGAMFEEPKHREPLRNLPIRRYFQVNRSLWKQDPDRVKELATLPNEAPASAFGDTVASITRGPNGRGIIEHPEFAKYRSAVQRYFQLIEDAAKPGSDLKAHQLAARIDALLTDKGNPQIKDGPPDLTVLWDNGDSKVRSVKRDLENLRDEVRFGDAFMVVQDFGKGKVLAVMSTAGKDWNDWGGGSASSVLYAPFVWETQNFLSSSGSGANLTVGTKIDFSIDAEQFRGTQLRLDRFFMRAESGKPSEKVKHSEDRGEEKSGVIPFELKKHLKPGLYISELFDDNAPGKAPIVTFSHVFNVDTAREGDMQRVSTDDLERELVSKEKDAIQLVTTGVQDGQLVSQRNDFSESPWLYLLFLLVLVAEQALAVHLSFHMKSDEQDLKPAGIKTVV